MLQSAGPEEAELKAREWARLKRTGPAKPSQAQPRDYLALSVGKAAERRLMQSLTLVSRGRGTCMVIGPSSPKEHEWSRTDHGVES